MVKNCYCHVKSMRHGFKVRRLHNYFLVSPYHAPKTMLVPSYSLCYKVHALGIHVIDVNRSLFPLLDWHCFMSYLELSSLHDLSKKQWLCHSLSTSATHFGKPAKYITLSFIHFLILLYICAGMQQFSEGTQGEILASKQPGPINPQPNLNSELASHDFWMAEIKILPC